MGSEARTEITHNTTLEASKINLQNLFNSMEDFVFVLNFESRIISVNSIVLERLKYSKDELIGKSVLMVHHPDQREEAAMIVGEILNGVREICPIPLLTKEGILIPVETKVTTGKWGNKDALFGISRDMTEHNEAKKELKDRQAALESIFKAAPTGIGIVVNRVITQVNDRFCDLVGYTREELLNKSARIVYPSDEVYELVGKEKYAQIAKYGIGTVETQFKKNNGEIIDVLVSSAVIDPNDHSKGVSFTALDITDRKRVEQKSKESERKYREAFSQANLYKDIFAHDINNILQNIQSSLELSSIYLKNPEKVTTVKELYGIIKEQVSRGSKLISNVRKLSTLQGSKFRLKSIKVNYFLKQSIKFLYQSFQTRKINIQCNYNKEDYFVFANELLLDVFENILLNAVRHNSNISVIIEIQITPEKIEGKKFLKVQFIDNGDGIEDVRKEHIFERGSKEKSSNGGMGLGLSLVKKTIDRYNGKIWVENKVKDDYSKGSNFILLIPTEK